MKPVNILGISAFYHDSAACLVRDGEIVAAAQEERFTRKKHDSSFPSHAVSFCLREGNIAAQDLDLVAFYEKPFLKFERLLQTYLAFAPVGLRSFLMSMPLWIKQRLWMRNNILEELGFAGKVIFPEHHESHAASAFFPSPFREAAFLTIDGVGEWTTTSYGIGRNNEVTILAELQFPHSLGLLYSAFTYYTGFKVNSGEYKVMGLAPYGEPKYRDLILTELMDLKEDGSFRLNMEYFDYCTGFTMTSAKFDRLFGGPPRKPESLLTQRDMDLARSVQEVTEEVMLRMARTIHRETGMKNLCLAGGVALNCVGNGKILREGPFENIWIQPAAGDAGGAVGAALFTWHQYLGNHREAGGNADRMRGAYLGPAWDRNNLHDYLQKNGIPFTEMNAIAKKQLAGYTFRQGKYVLKVEDAELYGKGDKLVVAANVSGSVKGTIYLTGTPWFDKTTNTLRIRELDFDVRTKNTLVKSASWLLKGGITGKLTESLSFPASEYLSEARKQIGGFLSQKHSYGYFTFTGRLDQIDIGRILITRSSVKALFTFSGNLTVGLKED